MSKAISGSTCTVPIFIIFSPNERYLREFSRSVPVFPIPQGNQFCVVRKIQPTRDFCNFYTIWEGILASRWTRPVTRSNWKWRDSLRRRQTNMRPPGWLALLTVRPQSAFNQWIDQSIKTLIKDSRLTNRNDQTIPQQDERHGSKHLV